MAPTVAALLSKYPLFAGLDLRTISPALEESRIVSHSAREKLFFQGYSADHLILVLEGAYKLQNIDSDGREAILYIGKAGETLGIMATMEPETQYPFDAISLTNSTAVMIPRKTFFKNWIKCPQIVFRFQTELQNRIFSSYNERLLQPEKLECRLACFFWSLIQSSSASSQHISFSLTRREIAAYLGVTVESVIRKLSLWEKQGILKISRDEIVILSSKTFMGFLSERKLELLKKSSFSISRWNYVSAS